MEGLVRESTHVTAATYPRLVVNHDCFFSIKVGLVVPSIYNLKTNLRTFPVSQVLKSKQIDQGVHEL